MSKYSSLWEWLKENDVERIILSFEEIENIAGVPIDHSFLKYKKELLEYGYRVGKISMKRQKVLFEKSIMEKTANQIQKEGSKLVKEGVRL